MEHCKWAKTFFDIKIVKERENMQCEKCPFNQSDCPIDLIREGSIGIEEKLLELFERIFSKGE